MNIGKWEVIAEKEKRIFNSTSWAIYRIANVSKTSIFVIYTLKDKQEKEILNSGETVDIEAQSISLKTNGASYAFGTYEFIALTKHKL